MKKTALALAVVSLLICVGLRVQKADTSSTSGAEQTTMKMAAGKVSSVDDRGPVTADINDSDEFFQNALNSAGPERDNSQKIENLLKRMTLEEKVGQMTQLTIGMISTGQDQNIQIDPDKLDKAIVRYGVGSILNVADQALTPDKWHDIIRQIQEAATKKTRLGIPVIYGIDSIHGANYVQGSTLFPQELGMAATRNPELMKRASEISAME